MNSTLVIDLGSLHRNFMTRFGKQIDYKKLIDFVKTEHTLVNVWAFGTRQRNADSFCRMLESVGVSVCLSRFNHNIDLTVCLMKLQTPTILVASDDVQYHPALNCLRNDGKFLWQYGTARKDFLFHEYRALEKELIYEQQLELPSKGDGLVPVDPSQLPF